MVMAHEMGIEVNKKCQPTFFLSPLLDDGESPPRGTAEAARPAALDVLASGPVVADAAALDVELLLFESPLLMLLLLLLLMLEEGRGGERGSLKMFPSDIICLDERPETPLPPAKNIII